VKSLRVAAIFAALILTASTAGAAVTDLGNALGTSGGYTNRASYEAELGQPMTADQQAYAGQEDELRQLGFQAELSGDFASGQMFYQMAYRLTPGSPSAALTWLGVYGEGSLAGRKGFFSAGAFGPSVFGAWYSTEMLSFLAWGDNGSTVNLPPMAFLSGVDSPPGLVPEPSTWAMTLIGFVGLAYVGSRGRLALVRAR
jgi:hypothetical protein